MLYLEGLPLAIAQLDQCEGPCEEEMRKERTMRVKNGDTNFNPLYNTEKKERGA